MTDQAPASGFRSLVQQIQENDGEVVERPRFPRRRLTLRRETPAEAADLPPPLASTTAPRLLARRWL